MQGKDRLSLTLPMKLRCPGYTPTASSMGLEALEEAAGSPAAPCSLSLYVTTSYSNAEEASVEDGVTADSYSQMCPTARCCSHLHGPGEHVGQHFFPGFGVFVSTKCFI